MTAEGGDLLAWLETAIARRESAARSASPGPWIPGGIGDYGWTVHTGIRSVETEDSEIGRADAKHIALNSPSAVLRRCAADRKELARHTPTEWPTQAPAVCPSCAHWNHDVAMGDSAASPVPFPCPSVLSLAEGYGWTEGER